MNSTYTNKLIKCSNFVGRNLCQYYAFVLKTRYEEGPDFIIACLIRKHPRMTHLDPLARVFTVVLCYARYNTLSSLI